MTSHATCEWMFGDAATGLLGFAPLAHMNPLRWSDEIAIKECITDLEKVLAHGSRPINIKIPAGIMSKERKFATTEEAIAHLRQLSMGRTATPSRQLSASERVERCEAVLAETFEKVVNSDLLMWKKPLKTGALLVSLDAVLGAVYFSDVALISCLSTLALFALLVGGFLNVVAPQACEQPKEVVGKDTMDAAVEAVAEVLTITITTAQDIALWTRQSLTIKALVALDILRRAAPWLGSGYFVIFAANMLILLPCVYHKKKELIEAKLSPVLAKVRNQKDALLAKIPKCSDVYKGE